MMKIKEMKVMCFATFLQTLAHVTLYWFISIVCPDPTLLNHIFHLLRIFKLLAGQHINSR